MDVNDLTNALFKYEFGSTVILVVVILTSYDPVNAVILVTWMTFFPPNNLFITTRNSELAALKGTLINVY